MKFTKLVAVAFTVAALGAGAVHAQIKETQPAEFPPASYRGKQYVDSKGCVFIRAGIDGNVSWVPRVTRKRKVVCGFQPTGGTQVASGATQPAAAPVQISIDQPAAVAPKPAPVAVAAAKPRPRIVRQTAPKPVRRVAKAPVVRQPVAPVRITPTAPARVTAVTTTRQAATICPNASALSQQYLRVSGKSAVRCGPQAEPIVGGTYNTAAAVPRSYGGLFKRAPASPVSAASVSNVQDGTRIVPRHVAVKRVNTTNVKVPHGYRRVWEDGRLNPKRAEQSLSGRGHMLLVWTNTVPRRLINQSTGRDVTASVPLVYPYIDRSVQSRELGEVSIVQRDGQIVKRIVRHRHAASAIRAQRQPVISSRSTPKPQAAAAAPKPRAVTQRAARGSTAKSSAGGSGYVQIGLFTTDAKARKAAQHLSGMGMGARIGKVRHKGKSYLSVQAGPFNGSSATQSAVSRLRGAGYSGARVR